MPLSGTAIRSAKPDAKDIKLSDERGLYLLVARTGGKLWRFKYRFEGKEKKLSFGSYPDVPLKEARRRRDEARRQLANGHDPSALKKAERAAKGERARNTFDGVAEEYLTHMERDGRQANTVGKARWLYSLIKDDLGPRPIADITPAKILAVLRTIEAKGNHETARRMRSLASRIFRFGAATSRVNADPTSLLRGALIAPKVKHHSAIVDVKEVGPLLRAIDGFTGQPLTKLALQLTPHVFVRPGELRRAEWQEFDLSEAVWTIPVDKMKMRRPHRVPLSRQSLAILDAAFSISAKQQYVFSSLYPGTRPMSENTINAALRRLGYSGKEMTAHGFRSMASTLLNESGLWREDAIERALAHQETNAVRGAYHRGQHWDERVDMAQWWSDFLDQQRENQSLATVTSS